MIQTKLTPQLPLIAAILLASGSQAWADDESIPCISGPGAMFLNYGDVVNDPSGGNCQISPAGDLDTFEFTGVAGEVVRLTVSDVGGGPVFNSVVVELRNQGNDVLESIQTSVNGGGAQLDVTLPTTGLFRLFVSELNDDETVAYQLGLNRLFPILGQQIRFDDVLTDMINPAADVDQFFFEVAARKAVLITLVDVGGGSTFNSVMVEVQDPNGTPLGSTRTSVNGGGTSLELTTSTEGVHSLVVTELGNDQPINYNLGLVCLTPPCPPQPPGRCNIGSSTSIEFGSLTSCEAPVDASRQTFLAPARQGVQEVTIQAAFMPGQAGGSEQLCLNIREPGSRVDLLPRDECSTSGLVKLDSSWGVPEGQYQVLVSSRQATQPVAYNLSVEQMWPPLATTLSLERGQTFDDEISPYGDVDTFLVTTNQEQCATLLRKEGGQPRLERWDQRGQLQPVREDPVCAQLPLPVEGPAATIRATARVEGGIQAMPYTLTLSDGSCNPDDCGAPPPPCMISTDVDSLTFRVSGDTVQPPFHEIGISSSPACPSIQWTARPSVQDLSLPAQTGVTPEVLSVSLISPTVARRQVEISSPSASNTVTIPVFTEVSPPPPPLSDNRKAQAIPEILNFPNGTLQEGEEFGVVLLTNSGDQPLRYSVEVSEGEDWLSATDGDGGDAAPFERTLQPGPGVEIIVRTDVLAIGNQPRTGTITFRHGSDLEFSTEVNVHAVPSDAPSILLSRTAIEFLVSRSQFGDPENQGDVVEDKFYILNVGSEPLDWEVDAGSLSWLSVDQARPISDEEPLASVSDPANAEIPAKPIRLFIDLDNLRRTEASGRLENLRDSYHGIIVVRDSTIAEVEQQKISITVRILPEATIALTKTSPSGFLFRGESNEDIEGQTLTVISKGIAPNNSEGKLQFQLQPSERFRRIFDVGCDGDPRCVFDLTRRARRQEITITPRALPEDDVEVLTPAPAAMNVNFDVDPKYAVPGDQGRQWEIEALVVRKPDATSQSTTTVSQDISCDPDDLRILFTSLSRGFRVAATTIVGLDLRIANECGDFLNSGSVIAVPSNGDRPIRFRPSGNGDWHGIWQPSALTRGGGESVRLEVIAFDGSTARGGKTLTGRLVPPAVSAPTISLVANSAAPLNHQNTISPGMIISLFGTEFLRATGDLSAAQFPLPAELGGVVVRLNEEPVPLLFAGRRTDPTTGGVFDQINALVPYDVTPNSLATVSVERDGLFSAPAQVVVAKARPMLYVAEGIAAALDADNQLITIGNPVAPGEIVRFFGTGLGQVDNPPAFAEPARADPLARVIAPVQVLFDGRPATILFAGLTPTFSGLYQIDVRAPDSLNPANASAQVTVTVDDVPSPPVPIPVQR